MIVKPGSTDVSCYFAMRLLTGGDATGLSITDFDLQYVRSGVAPVAKVDATALAATDSAHADNKGIEIDATDQSGLYRFDFPDAAFAAGVREVIVSAKHASCFVSHLRVELDGPIEAILDTASTVETGVTVRGLFRIIGAILAGKVSGGQSGTETFRNMSADTKDRVVSTNQSDGDRTALTLDMT